MLFLLFTFDYTFKCCGVAVKFSNLQCNIFIQLLDQSSGVLFSTEMCVQSAKDNGGTETSHANAFTIVT